MSLSPDEIFQRHQRQVHLDFHTSPHIPDVGREFDATRFARTVAGAKVNSMTVFAKCHHGMSYYPTQAGTPHPALGGRDLLGEQIEALHREGIRAPIYTTVAWEEDAAARFPGWRQICRNGVFADVGPSRPGGWKFLNFLHPGYQDYIEAHLRELCARYGDEVDGLFMDIVFFHDDACWSDPCVKFREDRGLTLDNPAGRARFQAAAQEAFAQRFTPLLRGITPAGATIFYNSHNDISVDSRVGPRARYPLMTHMEIESLPSGFWGYHHFPRIARALAHWGLPWLGMTGRFQRAWGDFGGLKPQAALEYECFRTQALGGANSVGDQLPPRGTLEPDAYELIGKVFAQCEAAETFYAGSRAIPQFGNLSASFPTLDAAECAKSDEGAMLMAQEVHYDVAMIDERADLAAFELVQLPDSVVVTPMLAGKLRTYYEAGGKLLLSYRSGFDADGRWALDFLPLTMTGREASRFPTYWRAHPEMVEAIGHMDRVCYMPGMEVLAGVGAQVVVDRVLPYFRRTDAAFSSHAQTPGIAEADVHPAVVAGERFMYFADPIFREFRQTGNLLMRNTWRQAMITLIGRAPFGNGLPTTVNVMPRRRGDDLLLTLLHYIPVRKALDIDVIEEASSFGGEQLRLPEHVEQARVFNGPALERAENGKFVLPMVKGRLLIEVPGYFAA